MAEETNIQWCKSTFNPWIGCQKIGPGCDHCYAEAMDARKVFAGVTHFGAGVPRLRTQPANWAKVRQWNKQAPQSIFAGRQGFWPVFCASLADIFDNAADPAWRSDFWCLVRECQNLTFLVLTKRIGNARNMLPPDWGNGYPNVWLGATIVNQAEADRDVPKLLSLPAACRFLSMEPLLGAVDLTRIVVKPAEAPERGQPPVTFDALWGWYGGPGYPYPDRLDWVIVGGESGPNARPMHPDWARGLRDQCETAETAFLFKQWGEWHTSFTNMSDGSAVFRQFSTYQQWVNKASTWVNGGICLDRHGREMMNGADMMRARDEGSFPATIMHRVGKKAAGRMLDGLLHDGFPDVGDNTTTENRE